MKELQNLARKLQELGDDRGFMLEELLNEKKELMVETKIGVLKIVPYDNGDGTHHIITELNMPSGEVNTLSMLTTVEKENGELDAISSIWSGNTIVHLGHELSDKLNQMNSKLIDQIAMRSREILLSASIGVDAREINMYVMKHLKVLSKGMNDGVDKVAKAVALAYMQERILRAAN